MRRWPQRTRHAIRLHAPEYYTPPPPEHCRSGHCGDFCRWSHRSSATEPTQLWRLLKVCPASQSVKAPKDGGRTANRKRYYRVPPTPNRDYFTNRSPNPRSNRLIASASSFVSSTATNRVIVSSASVIPNSNSRVRLAVGWESGQRDPWAQRSAVSLRSLISP